MAIARWRRCSSTASTRSRPMSKGGGSSSQKVKTQNKPWGPAIPYATDVLAQAQNLFSNCRPQPSPGSTVADMSPETTAALQAMWDRASGGNPLTSMGQNTMAQILAGAGGVPDSSFNFLTGVMGGGYSNPALPF